MVGRVRCKHRLTRRPAIDKTVTTWYAGASTQWQGSKPLAEHASAREARTNAAREARFQVLDRIRRRVPDIPAQEVAQDVTAAIEAVRAARAQGRP